MPSRRAIASGLPKPSGACSHATSASPITFCSGTRTLTIQSSARPSSWPESAAVHGRTMLEDTGPYVASSSLRRYFGPRFSTGSQLLSRSQLGYASIAVLNDFSVGVTAAAAAGPAWPSPTPRLVDASATTRVTRGSQARAVILQPSTSGRTALNVRRHRLLTMTADDHPGGVHVLDDSEVERVLVVTAHPDDVDFGAAGTISTFTAAGLKVTYCVCTDGDAGGFDPAVPRSEIPGIRRAEQVAAAKAVGVEDVRFLGYRDGSLEPTQDLRRDISRVIRQVRPQRMLIQSPERNWIRIGASHPDHLASGA